MIDKIRFQEIENVILKAPMDMTINGKCYKKGQPVMIINKPSLSVLEAHGEEKQVSSRGYEGSNSTLDYVNFNIVDGYISLGLWNAIFGDVKLNTETLVTKRVGVDLINEDKITLPDVPKDLFLYLINVDTGAQELVSSSQYTINGKDIILSTSITRSMIIVYTTNINAMEISTAKQIGSNLVLELEIMGTAYDPISGDKFNISIQCPKVNVSVDLNIGFNAQERVSFTPIHCKCTPSLAKNGINKSIFDIVVF